MDFRNMTLLGTVAAAAVAAGAYILFGPSTNKRRRRRGVCPGLINMGNTCFLNAILQAMAPCSTVVQWLNEFTSKSNDYKKYLAPVLQNVLGVLNNDSIEHTEEYCPSELMEALHARRWVIPKEEQDAHELFNVLTETLDEECTKYPAVLSLCEVKQLEESDGDVKYQPDHEARSRIHSQLPVIPNHKSDHPFRGLLASQLQCKCCGSKLPVKYDTFDSLSLNLPGKYVGHLTLDHLMKQFIMSETVQNVDCAGCGKQVGSKGPLPKSTFVKKLTIGKLPQCLCLHIQRTVWLNSGVPMKKYEPVAFPEVLNMGEYVYSKNQPRKPFFLPISSIDGEMGSRLVGGRNKNGFSKFGGKSSRVTSPTVSVPYSGPVNVLKALNYHTKTAITGLSVGTSQEPIEQTNSNVQRLAQAYTTETFSPINTQHAYKLSSVVVHLGDVFSGHFVTYRRIPTSNGQRFPDRWLYTSDTLVKKASAAEVMQANAYMLFYEKI